MERDIQVPIRPKPAHSPRGEGRIFARPLVSPDQPRLRYLADQPPVTATVDPVTKSKRHIPSLKLPTNWRGNWQKHPQRAVLSVSIFTIISVLLFGVMLPYLDNRWKANAYALSDADTAVIAKTNEAMAVQLTHDAKSQTYNFNTQFSPTTDSSNDAKFGGAKISVKLSDDPAKGVTVTDPYNQVDLTLTPKFAALAAKQSKNQVQYPIQTGHGSLVYTAEAGGVKEDLLLRQYAGDSLDFSYKIGLGDQYAARLQTDGSVGIFGSSLPISGNVSTSNAKDAELLSKARRSAVKDKLLFSLPAPVIHQQGGKTSPAKAKFSLKGDVLSVSAINLKKAAYPLSIDPSVSVTSVSDFFRDTNIDTNADFDAANNQVTRGTVTGGATDTWAASTTMNQVRFLNGAAAYNGFLYVVGGAASGATTNIAGSAANMVEFASITAATLPTASTIGTWASGNNTGLPAAGLSRFQLIAYNGYLYAIGGSGTDTTCAAANLSTVVYSAVIQNNGVLGNWSNATGAPATKRCSFGAAAYNAKIYIAGGKTDSTAASGSTDVSYAIVNPNGTLTWVSGTTPALPAARYGADIQAYNGYLYLVGGNLNGTLTNTVLYAALNTDGSIYAASGWLATNNFTTARENFGAVFTAVRNGYIYLSGGCKNVNASLTCNASTDAQSDAQLAQINADGSLGQWFSTTSLTGARVGTTMVAWRGTLYSVGGCAATNAASIFCTTALATTQYGTLTTPGQASVLKTSANNLPTALYGAGSVVNNGFLYVVGGCITNSCQTGGTDTTNGTSFAQINADGTLGAWTTDTTHTINGANGVAETSLVVANGTLYAFGGYTYNGVLGNAGNNNIWTVTPNANGTLPANWASNATTMTSREYAMSALYYNGNVYTFGGCVASSTTFGCSTYSQEVTKYSVNGTTVGAGSTTNLTQLTAGTIDFPNAVMALAFYDGYVYLCGGANSNANGGQTNKCVYHALASAGTMTGAWSTTGGSLTQQIRRGSAYATNGYLYVYSGHNGSGTPVTVGDIYIGKINASTGDVASFTKSSTAFTPKWDTTSVFTDGNIYTVGGCTTGDPPTSCSARSAATEYFAVYNATNSGTRAVTGATALPTALTGIGASISGGYLYIAGGCVSISYIVSAIRCNGGGAPDVNASSYAKINPDGSLASWTTGPNLPAATSFGCMQALNGYLYFMGGQTGETALSAVRYSQATGANWSSGSWLTASNALPAIRTQLSCGVYNNHLYATGGEDNGNTGTMSNLTYYSAAIPNGGNTTGAWTATTTAFTTSRIGLSTVAAGGYLYIMGGYDGTNFLSNVQYAAIASDGSLGTWSFAIDLPLKMFQNGAFAANGYIYVTAGSNALNATGCLNRTFVAPINANGSIGSWSQGVAASFTAVTGAGVAYDDGYYYVLGGSNCTANTTATNYAGEQSQAIRGVFSRYIDMASDATPWKFLSNGTHATVSGTDIDKWRLRYISSRVATNAWGAESALNPIVFGSSPVSISAIDASSVNQGVSRYWLLTFDIDQTSSFTFTDDVQPVITDYDFYYAPGGTARLRNGRTFQDQTKQSLDAHP